MPLDLADQDYYECLKTIWPNFGYHYNPDATAVLHAGTPLENR